MSAFEGHLQTLLPYLRDLVRPPRPPLSTLVRTETTEGGPHPVTLRGHLSDPGGADTLVVIVHGMGGSAQSSYMLHLARALHRRGLATLRVNLRGADRSGAGIYHAGLVEDLRAFVDTPEARRYDKVLVAGFSLGGHVTFRFAATSAPRRVAGVVAVCAPMDLRAGAITIDAPERRFYLGHLLRGLKEIYRMAAPRVSLPLPLETAMRIPTLREWDERVVAAHFGFDGAEGYWREMSAGPLLSLIPIPAIYVGTTHDPMVVMQDHRPALDAAPNVETHYSARGGHVGFPAQVDLGMGDTGDAYSQLACKLVDLAYEG